MRIHVLFVVPSLRGGGSERVIVTLLRHLDRSKFKLSLAIVDMNGAIFKSDVPDDVELIDLQCSRVRHALLKMIRLIWQRRPDVVFSTLGHLNLALAMLRPLLPNRVRYIGRETCVVSELQRESVFPRLAGWMYRYFYPRFDVVVCQSMDMRNDLIKQFGFPATKAVIIHNPVDIERIHRLASEVISRNDEWPEPNSDGAPHFVAAGRLAYQKGFDLLIEALALGDGTRPRLTLLGEGPLRPALEQLARRRGVADRIRFLGFESNPYPLFAHADAFILSSRYEGLPNVVLEALACGTQVIAVPAPGGINEIAKLAGGVLLAAAVDAESLSVAIQRFVNGERRMGSVDLTPFSVETIVRQYQDLLSDEGLTTGADDIRSPAERARAIALCRRPDSG